MRIKDFNNNVALKVNAINHNEYIAGLFDTTKAQDSFESIRLSQVSFCGFFEKLKLKSEAIALKKDAKRVFNSAEEIKKKSDKFFIESHYLLGDSKIILRNSYKILSQVMELIGNAKENNIVYDLDSQSEGVVRRFRKDADRFIMDELISGTCTRKTVLEDKTLRVIEYLPENKQNVYIFDNETQRLVQYLKDTKTSPVGCKAQKSFIFDNDELVAYDSNLISRYGEMDKSKERYIFKNSRLTDHIIDFEDDFGGLKKFGEHYAYLGKGLNFYLKNFKSISGVCDTCDERFMFGGSDSLKKYDLNSVKVIGADETSDAYYIYENNQPTVICIGNLITADGHRQYDKMVEFHKAPSAQPKLYYQDYKITDKLIKSYNRKIEL